MQAYWVKKAIPADKKVTLTGLPFATTQVERLRKVYGPTVAVHDISFENHEGEIFGMVGPNGAGKTTTIECIEGFRQSDRGDMLGGSNAEARAALRSDDHLGPCRFRVRECGARTDPPERAHIYTETHKHSHPD